MIKNISNLGDAALYCDFGIEVNNEKVILSNEHCDYKWVDFETASSHLVWNGQKKGIQAVNQMLLSNDDRMKWSLINFNNISSKL